MAFQRRVGIMSEQLTVENATDGLEPECRNWTTGNCSALGPMTGGSPGAWMITSLMMYGIICAAGTVGNGLVIYVVLRSDVCMSVRLSVVSYCVSNLYNYSRRR